MFIPKSFNYFKLGILFYILCKINNIKSRENRFSLFNKINEFNKDKDVFDKIYKHIFKRKNCLIFTYYMQIPNIFQAIPDELIYYKPFITFYYSSNYSTNYSSNDVNYNISNDFSILQLMNNYYTDRIRIHEDKREKWLSKVLQDQHIFPNISTIYIPINENIFIYMNQFTKKEKDVLYLMFYDDKIYVGRRINDANKFNIIYSKKLNGKYIKTNNLIIDIYIKKLVYIMALLPITRDEIIKTFDIDVINKNSLLYHNRSDDLTENVIRNFYALYPDVNLIDPYGLFKDADYHCFLYKLKKDIVVLNLNKDIFYHYLFDEKDDKKDFIYKDTRNNKNLIKDKLFHCMGNYNRKQCNFNIIKDYGNNKTWEKNKGKRMLALIIAKSSLYWLSQSFYYIDFLAHYDIDAFIYHYGIFRNKLLSAELGFTKNPEKYVEYVSMKKGACSEHSSKHSSKHGSKHSSKHSS
jgi:hypothetical protein